MITTPFIVMTLGILGAALLIRPQSIPLRFALRLPFVLLGILAWAYNTGFFISWWGYAGHFPLGFGLYCLPLCVALFPRHTVRNALVFTILYLLVTMVYLLRVTLTIPIVPHALAKGILPALIQDIPVYLLMGSEVLVMALPGVSLVWLFNGGIRRIEQWEKARAQRCRK